MKGDKNAVFTPADADDTGTEGDDEDASTDKIDDLLGNAFDALDDGDRAGFIRSLKAAINTG